MEFRTKREAEYAANEARDGAIREHDMARACSEDGARLLAELHRTRASVLELRAQCIRALLPTLPEET